MAIPIIIPLINPNEPEALIVSLEVEEGKEIKKGEIICTLETTKSTVELTAESDGYVVGIQNNEGDIVKAGVYLGYIAPTKDWEPPMEQCEIIVNEETYKRPQGLRITQPALEIAKEYGIDLSEFSKNSLITAAVVRENIGKMDNLDTLGTTRHQLLSRLIIYGGGGHGKSVLDLIRALRIFTVEGFIDDNLSTDTDIMGVPVLGADDVLEELYSKGIHQAVNAVGGIGNIAIRIEVFRKLIEVDFSFPTIIHPTAFVEPSAHLSAGVQVFPHAYIGSDAHVGFGSIVNTGAIVSHDCDLGDYVNISPGAILAGEIHVGNGSLIGMGATINLQVSIGSGARVGNTATVKSDVPDKGIVRAGTIWPK
ncbi:MAG: NeuD/PglB/VioB family sugar acetyltransferase [Anaerolineales bacterium]|nr:NeuD/PglB/VioB family sugar acetyltransferase [Anaerolineales bacterium]